MARYRVSRKAFLFALDALIAALILIAGIMVVSRISQHESDTLQIETAGDDVLTGLQSMRIADFADSLVIARIADGNISDANVSVLEQIGYFWATNKSADAQTLAEKFLENQYSDYGMRLTIDNVLVYERNTTRGGNDVAVASRMISGIAEGKAITGSSAVAYLRRIKDKRTASFTPFGGFIGEGNISLRFLDLPSDANITSIYLEMAPGAAFSVAFNNVTCGGTLTAPVYNGTPYGWDLSSCNSSLILGGTNTIGVNFSGPLNTSYVVGGFLRVKYKTSTLSGNVNGSFVQYHFPGITGIINLYDAFYVPGTLRNMSVYLHYNATNSTFFNIGEKQVWVDTPNGTSKIVILNDSYLRNPSLGKLDYDFLSNKTIPIRFSGFEYNSVVVTSGDADIVLITDFSGSMKKAVADWTQGNNGGTCESNLNSSSIRRTEVAQCVDANLVDIVMNYSGNRIWPVNIYDDKVKWYNNPSDGAAVKSWITSEDKNGKGKTCYACALNLAHDILQNFSNSSRKKFVVFMTDGTPTHCASGSCVSNSTSWGALQCAGLCDQSGSCGQTDIPAACAACVASPGGQTNANSSATRLRNNLNATIYTVGFGPIDDCSFAGQTLQYMANIGNGTYQHSNDSAALKLIYDNISLEILSKSVLVAQIANVVGAQSRSKLFDDSYINITYDLAAQYLPTQNEIAVTLQTSQACNPTVPLYAEQKIIDAKALSYSGTHWADYLGVNGVEAYNLSSFLLDYNELGDPTAIQVPLQLFTTGNNTFDIQTGDSVTNRTGCFVNDSVIYTVGVNLSTERSTVVPNSVGCAWIVQFEDDTFQNITVPSSYIGNNTCSYTASSISYDSQDAYQLGAYTIFQRLDFRKTGKLYVNLRDEDLEVIVTTISRVPYLWGPAVARIEVTR